MSETGYGPEPHAVALSLIRTAALDETTRQAPGADGGAANWDMDRRLTTTLEVWQADDTLRENSLLLVDWLSVNLIAFVLHQLGDLARVERWLRDFGDEVCQAQQHGHPAGPTAIEILSVVADDLTPAGPATPGSERLARIGASYLRYMRDGHEVQDAREMALTFALWAGSQLAALLADDAERITAYMDARDQAAARS